MAFHVHCPNDSRVVNREVKNRLSNGLLHTCVISVRAERRVHGGEEKGDACGPRPSTEQDPYVKKVYQTLLHELFILNLFLF